MVLESEMMGVKETHHDHSSDSAFLLVQVGVGVDEEGEIAKDTLVSGLLSPVD